MNRQLIKYLIIIICVLTVALLINSHNQVLSSIDWKFRQLKNDPADIKIVVIRFGAGKLFTGEMKEKEIILDKDESESFSNSFNSLSTYQPDLHVKGSCTIYIKTNNSEELYAKVGFSRSKRKVILEPYFPITDKFSVNPSRGDSEYQLSIDLNPLYTYFRKYFHVTEIETCKVSW